MKAEKAAFKISDYYFGKVYLKNTREPLDGVELDFEPSGVFDKQASSFELRMVFKAFDETIGKASPLIEIEFISTFIFTNVNALNEIPDFFYRNSIAIVFPYLRSYISNLTLLSNSKLLILPTMNLSKLEDPLRVATTEI